MAKNTKNNSAVKKLKLTSREKIFILVIVLLVAALVTVLALDGLPANLFPKNEKVNYSFLSGESTISLPQEFDINTLLEVHFIDVGQGDAVLIRLPDGKDILIDSGSGTSVSNANRTKHLEYLESMNLGEIDYMIVTHPDSDHINMLSSILMAYEVKNIYYNNINGVHSQTYTRFLDDAENEGATLFAIDDDGDIWTIDGGSYGYKLTVIAPGHERFEDTNAMSVICLLEYGGVEALFMGDATSESEQWYMDNFDEPDIEILKVGHHGSPTSSSLAFLQSVDPEYAVISAGKGNSYKHPDPEIMTRLFDEGIVTYRTDRHGTVILYIDADGDYGFLPEKDVMTENNTNNILDRKLSATPAAA